ncbi:hypothetical protein BDZ85DRAFT_267116 [Elsinoe ampelina]|uniref:WW domain-containing protein n=1 Tax=Elsinoe ampelina TaxID=302913 RepID=A0A6A6G4X7_9PEZI|nr:hypothetical protein BDZ85DRAFT_267116 [Elsinoe ampelina]
MADESAVTGTKRARSPPTAEQESAEETVRKQAKMDPTAEEPAESTTSLDAKSRLRSPSEEGEEPDDAPPLPDEEPPPLPEEEPPAGDAQDDGWEPRWDYSTNAWYYFNRFTGVSQWENPRVPEATTSASVIGAPGTDTAPGTAGASQPAAAGPPPNYMGYNPKIHGDFDPNADYARFHQSAVDAENGEAVADGTGPSADDLGQMYQQTATFNRFTGSFQSQDRGPDAHNDENKSKRQMEAFFDVDKAANAHEGRSLKAQRQRQKLSKEQIQEYNNKKKAKKIKRDRDWLTS